MNPAYLVVVNDKEGYGFANINDALAKVTERGGTLYARCYSAQEAVVLEEAEAHEARRQIADKALVARNNVEAPLKSRRKSVKRMPFAGVQEQLWKKFHLG